MDCLHNGLFREKFTKFGQMHIINSAFTCKLYDFINMSDKINIRKIT